MSHENFDWYVDSENDKLWYYSHTDGIIAAKVEFSTKGSNQGDLISVRYTIGNSHFSQWLIIANHMYANFMEIIEFSALTHIGMVNNSNEVYMR